MKKLLFFCAVLLGVGIAGNVYAALWDRGGGLIYDDVLNITWLQDANYAKTSGYDADGGMVWAEAVNWAANLTYYDSVRGITYDDWRLPHALPLNGSSYTYNFAYDGSSDRGFNISTSGTVYQGSTASEMAYMFYNTLGNKGYADVNGNEPQPGWGWQDTGPFFNLQSYYWSDNECEGYLEGGEVVRSWSFSKYGHQYNDGQGLSLSAWAVRDGDIGLVPIPGAVWLLSSGLIGIVGFRKTWRNGHLFTSVEINIGQFQNK